ncbi:hypothetical protein DL767_008812 [Monosporascus sp. MG133]|nr:hypothetical protein DL767_008812 [Monosporascus sp. MG133]
MPPLRAKDHSSTSISMSIRSCRLSPELSNAWHPTRIDYFDVTSVTKDLKGHCKNKYCSDAEEKLRLVTHPSSELSVLMKIVEFRGQLRSVARETRACQVPDGKAIAPRFPGHVTEAGRVVGFLLEVSPTVFPIWTTPSLKEGKVILIDFEQAETRVDALARAKGMHYLTSSMLGRDPYYDYDYSSEDEEADECELYRSDDGTF